MLAAILMVTRLNGNGGYMELLDLGARRYDPQLGRFLSPDTIIPDPANPQSFNRYSYVYNNPVKYTANGHCPWCVVPLVVAVGLLLSGCGESGAGDNVQLSVTVDFTILHGSGVTETRVRDEYIPVMNEAYSQANIEINLGTVNMVNKKDTEAILDPGGTTLYDRSLAYRLDDNVVTNSEGNLEYSSSEMQMLFDRYPAQEGRPMAYVVGSLNSSSQGVLTLNGDSFIHNTYKADEYYQRSLSVYKEVTRTLPHELAHVFREYDGNGKYPPDNLMISGGHGTKLEADQIDRIRASKYFE